MPITIAHGTPNSDRTVYCDSANASGSSTSHMVESMITIGANVSPDVSNACVNT